MLDTGFYGATLRSVKLSLAPPSQATARQWLTVTIKSEAVAALHIWCGFGIDSTKMEEKESSKNAIQHWPKQQHGNGCKVINIVGSRTSYVLGALNALVSAATTRTTAFGDA
jgi:hypothetical protein